ncbi:AraC family transcriptional regulator [Streptomyces sp. KL116D]|uniref:AraC family transcriptional regulator n=1 Tax=Streptomyces sp. KL116D TaxID=3045152 RepID=UPI0035579E59
MAAGEGRGAEFHRYVTREVEETRTAIAAHYYDLDLEVTRGAGEFVASLGVVTLGALTVGDISFGAEMRMSFGEPGVHHVAVPLTGGFAVRQGGGPAACTTADRAVFFDPGHGIRIEEWSADCYCLTVKIDKAALHAQLETLLGRPLARPPRFGPYLDISRGPGRSWTNLVQWSLLEQDVSHGLLHQPIIAGRLEQTLLEGLLLASDHPYREALEAPPPGMRPAAVKRVMDAVRERPAEPYDAAGLAAIAQVSLRTLQEAFRRNVGMSPMAYVSEVRLQRVRQQLRASVPGTVTVTDVAYEWGFAHLGRFARRYRVRFGETPSQTLRSA